MISEDKFVLTKRWREPLMCRWFGHDWRETIYTVLVIEAIGMSESLFVCKRCGAGRHRTFQGMKHFVPSAVERFVKEEELKQMARTNDVIPLKKESQ